MARGHYGVRACLRLPRPRMLWWWRARYALRATAKRAYLRNRSNRRAVPLPKIQTDVLRLLASHRDPESYPVATPLNRDAVGSSADIDVFHDREERVAVAALEDARVLAAAAYRVTWLRQLPLIYTAEVILGDARRGG